MTGKNIYQRMADVTDKIGAFEKDGRNAHFNYKFAGIESIVRKLNPVLKECGVILVTTVVDIPQQIEVMQMSKAGWNKNQVTQVRIKATAINIDNPEETISVESYGFGVDSQDKGVYKAVSGARKYAIFLLFNLMSGADDPEYSHGKIPPAMKTPEPESDETPDFI